MNKELTTELSKITMTSASPARKRTINQCAKILSLHGHLVDFEKNSGDSVKFFVEIKQEKISTLLISLRGMEYIKEAANPFTPSTMDKRKTMLVNVSLNFLSN